MLRGQNIDPLDERTRTDSLHSFSSRSPPETRDFACRQLTTTCRQIDLTDSASSSSLFHSKDPSHPRDPKGADPTPRSPGGCSPPRVDRARAPSTHQHTFTRLPANKKREQAVHHTSTSRFTDSHRPRIVHSASLFGGGLPSVGREEPLPGSTDRSSRDFYSSGFAVAAFTTRSRSSDSLLIRPGHDIAEAAIGSSPQDHARRRPRSRPPTDRPGGANPTRLHLLGRLAPPGTQNALLFWIATLPRSRGTRSPRAADRNHLNCSPQPARIAPAEKLARSPKGARSSNARRWKRNWRLEGVLPGSADCSRGLQSRTRDEP